MTAPQQFAIRERRRVGWFSVDNEIIDKYGTRVGAYGVAVYAVLCGRCNPSTQQVSTLSQRDIASILGISQDRIRKTLADLVDAGLIHVAVSARPSPGVISTITLLKVKKTERHTFSSGDELNATRSANKEVITKTKTTPPFSQEFDLDLKENARACEASETPRTYSQKDFDERDLRKLGDAYKEINLRRAASAGSGRSITDREVFEWACELAGISIARGLEVESRGKQWPPEEALGASA